MVDRRRFLKTSIAAAVAASVPGKLWIREAFGAPAALGLSDPAGQPKFVENVPDALAPSFKFMPDKKGRYKIKVGASMQQTGLVGLGGNKVNTPVWGYGDFKDRIYTWPGRTFEVKSVNAGGPRETEVIWANGLNGSPHLLPVDTSLHWCYALHGYEGTTIANAGVPIITHLHGGHTDFQFDGNPEFFYNPDETVIGPQWANVWLLFRA